MSASLMGLVFQVPELCNSQSRVIETLIKQARDPELSSRVGYPLPIATSIIYDCELDKTSKTVKLPLSIMQIFYF